MDHPPPSLADFLYPHGLAVVIFFSVLRSPLLSPLARSRACAGWQVTCPKISAESRMDGASTPLPSIARRPAPWFSRRDFGDLSISFEEENVTAAGCALRKRGEADNDEKAVQPSIANAQNAASRSAPWPRRREAICALGRIEGRRPRGQLNGQE